jgi:hypothetical protein
MSTHPEIPGEQRGERLDILLVTGKGRGPRQLARRLVVAGHHVDLAATEEEAIAAFYRRGGHQVCVIGPLPQPRGAASLVRELRRRGPIARA